MAKSTILFRQCIVHRPSRHVSSSSSRRTSTSPQRRSLAAPALANSLKPFNDIPGPLALPMLRHSAHVLPRIGKTMLRLAFSRHVSSSSSRQTSTSPQRRSLAAPALANSLKPFNDIPGPLALPMLRHSAHVLPRIGKTMLRLAFSRHVSSSSSRQTSTSPQRRSLAAPALANSLKPFNDIPGPLALPMLRHSAHVLPRIGKTMLRLAFSRHVSSSSSRQTSTSPQRRSLAAPALASSLKPFNDIPGSLALPMLRQSAHVLPRIGNFHHTVGLGLLEGLRERYGDLVRLAKASRTRPVLYVFDPEMMREVYESCATEAPRWLRSPLQAHRTAAGCPFHSDETKAIWASIGALLQDPDLLKNFEKAFDDIAVDATRRIGELRNAENALNEELETEVYRWALETLGMAALGTRLGCLSGNAHIPTADNRKPEKTSMDDDIPDLCSLSKRCPNDLTPAEALVRCAREITEAGYLVRSEHTLKPDSKTFNNALQALDKHYSLTEHLLLQAISDVNSLDPKPEQILLNKLSPLKHRILPLVADVLLAGVTPLAQSALAMLYHLSLNPARQQRAHDEVSWAAASKEAGAGVQEMPYLAACAREALRLHPATGGVVRRSKEDISVGGYEVPAGVDIVLAHGVTSKSEQQWGRAKAFIPERWCSEGWEPLRASRAHPLASLPFGTSCPASGITGHILASLATRVLERYRLEWHGPAPNLVTTGVNKVQAPYYFVLQDAH